MFAEKRVVLVAAVVLVVCGLLLSNASPVIEAKPISAAVKATPAKTSTALTISAPSSARVKQSFSITSKLTANGARLSKSIVYLQRFNGNTWATLASQVATTGTYFFSRTETTASTYQYRTTYTGSTSCASATSPTATVNVKLTAT